MRRMIVLVGLVACDKSRSPDPAPAPPVRVAPLVDAVSPDEVAALEPACAKGDQLACARHGFYLIKSSHDPQRVAKAIDLWTTACEKADVPLACSNLGAFYDDGEGVPQDPVHAAKLFAKACARDDGFACGVLATDYKIGRGVDRDRPKAFQLAQRGCELGSHLACTTVGLGLVEGWGGSTDLAKAAGLFRTSCEAEDVAGCWQLGLAYKHGRGVAGDPKQARVFFEKACQLGAEPDDCARELKN
jgi:TPR repeat protein